MNKKLFFTTLGSLLLLATIIYFFFPEQNKPLIPLENQQPTTTEEQSNTSTQSSIFEDQSGIKIIYPKNWDERLKIQTNLDEENHRLISSNYLDSDNSTSLIFLLTIYPASEINMAGINNLPNHNVVLVTTDNFVAQSRPLDMPFEPNTDDFNRYEQILKEREEVLKSLSFSNSSYAVNIRDTRHDEQTNANINLNYPLFESQPLNQQITSTTEQLIAEFKNNVANWNEETTNSATSEEIIPESSLHINYDLLMFNDNFASLRFDISEYMSGSAHPNNYYISFNFDLKNNKRLELPDLFKIDSTDYLSKLSQLTLADLKKQFVAREIDPENDNLTLGTQPKLDNFANFNLTEQGIMINFNPYQIVPYPAGSFNSLILYTDLKDDLNDEYSKTLIKS